MLKVQTVQNVYVSSFREIWCVVIGNSTWFSIAHLQHIQLCSN